MLHIAAGGFEFVARLEEEDAPQTVAAFRRLLPLESRIIHVRWSGEGGWIPWGDLDLGLGPENATRYPSPGELIIFPGGVSEAELLLAYGYVAFASKAGALAGNHFATMVEGKENLRELGRRMLWEGAQEIVFTERCSASRRGADERRAREPSRREQFPEWAELPVERVTSFGTDHALYRLGTELVARLPRREVNERSLKNERRWLPKLAPHLPLAVPVPLAEGRPGHGYPFEWSVYRWLEGEPATASRSPRGQQRISRSSSARSSASTRAMRRAPAGTTPPAASRSRGATSSRVLPSPRFATRSTPTRRRRCGTRRVAAPVWDRAPVWHHGDLDVRNLLVTDGRLSGVIDFGCLGAGDPACDVAVAWKVRPRGGARRLPPALAVDDATWLRARGWVVSQAVGALAYYTLENNRVLVLEARRWLDEVLTTARP